MTESETRRHTMFWGGGVGPPRGLEGSADIRTTSPNGTGQSAPVVANHTDPTHSAGLNRPGFPGGSYL